jgi:large subunit ribosomal protein L25
MEEIVLKAERRTVIGKQVKALRRAGKLPAVIYGHHIAPVAISLDARDTGRTLAGVSGSHLITIDLEGERLTTLVRDKQRNPIRGHLTHIDFLAVSMTEKLRTSVAIELHGEAPAVKELDGVLVKGLEEVEVECLPADLPESIVVDISSLKAIGDAIYVRDLVLPAAVEVLEDADEMIVLVTAQAAEEVEEVAAAAAEPEVIEKGKKEEEIED